ncbi:MAG TPA: hypothetical protein VJ625_17670 [Propionibacteriaceae bacterium]|nr:hypothetical protein [Propionibacteriaceae bacterium]
MLASLHQMIMIMIYGTAIPAVDSAWLAEVMAVLISPSASAVSVAAVMSGLVRCCPFSPKPSGVPRTLSHKTG